MEVQLVRSGARGTLPDEGPALELLLEFVDGQGATIDNGHVVVEVPGVLVDGLEPLVDRSVALLSRVD